MSIPTPYVDLTHRSSDVVSLVDRSERHPGTQSPSPSSIRSIFTTSSEKGTVVRVWSIPGAEKLYQFKRGTREARIYSISFNVVSSLLAVSSAHDTVHNFKLGSQKSSTSPGSSSSKGGDQPSSPPVSLDSREGVQDLDRGYEAFIEKKKSSSVS